MKCFRYICLCLCMPLMAHANLEQAIRANHYNEVISILNHQLEEQPYDASTLFLKAMYARTLKLDEAEQAMNNLNQHQPDYGLCLQSLSLQVEQKLDKQLPQNLDHAAIITLGSPVDDSGKPGKQLLERLKKTLSLGETYPSVPIIVSGSAVYSKHDESKVMKQWLIDHGLHPERIIRENKARNTIENIKNSIKLLPSETEQVILVSNQSHIKRAYLIFDAVLKKSSSQLKIHPAAGRDNLTDAELKERKIIEKTSSYRDRAKTMGYLHLHNGLAEVDPCRVGFG